jgi:transcriptional regulator with XRE-family HTH domain
MEQTLIKPGRPNLIREQAPNRLKEYRMKAGLTQKQVAAAIGVKVSTYANAENYGRSIGKDGWYRLADFFQVDPRILEGRDIPLF